MDKFRATATAAAFLFLALFVGAIGVRFWASAESSAIVGPDHIAVNDNAVFVHVNGELYVLSPAGELLARHPTAPLMRNDQLIDLRTLADGRLLLARRDPAALYACEPIPWQCVELPLPVAEKLRNQYKALPDESGGRLLISDFDGALLRSQPLAGGEPRLLTAADQLKGPNDLAFDRTGRLWVADSAGHRLTVFRPNTRGGWEVEKYHGARSRHAQDGRNWPMMLALAPDGALWVTQPDPLGRRADLLIYEANQGAVARVELPGGAIPTDIAPHGGAMLVTDMDNFRLYRVDAASRAVSAFGGAEFNARMQAARERKAGYEKWVDRSTGPIIVFAMFMVLAAVGATPKEKRWSRAPAAPPLAARHAPAPALSTIHWLRRNPHTERKLRWIVSMSWGITVLTLVTLSAAYFVALPGDGEALPPEKQAKLAEMTLQLFVILLLSLGIPVLMRMAARNLKHRLGTDGRTLYVKLADGRQLSLAPQQLAYDARRIAYRDLVFPVGNAQHALYEAGEIETFIAPLLVRAKKLGPLEMLRYQLAHREPMVMGTLVWVAVSLVAIVATGMWRYLLPDLG